MAPGAHHSHTQVRREKHPAPDESVFRARLAALWDVTTSPVPSVCLGAALPSLEGPPGPTKVVALASTLRTSICVESIGQQGQLVSIFSQQSFAGKQPICRPATFRAQVAGRPCSGCLRALDEGPDRRCGVRAGGPGGGMFVA
jgi:hypothetical protein